MTILCFSSRLPLVTCFELQIGKQNFASFPSLILRIHLSLVNACLLIMLLTLNSLFSISNVYLETCYHLIPDECFVADKNADKSKKFTCKQCSKEFKSAYGVKQHVAAMHKAKRRGADNPGNPSKKYLKKAFLVEDFDPIRTSTQGNCLRYSGVQDGVD